MKSPAYKVLTSLVILALFLALVPPAQSASAMATELFFSEYIEGSSNNKALEIFNGTGAAVDLAAGGITSRCILTAARALD